MIARFCVRLGVLVSFCLAAAADEAPRETVQFKASDGLQVTADVYVVDKSSDRPFLILLHQARWSRGEYIEVAPWLNDLGYNCMAVDLRSGNTINGVVNETAKVARETERPDSCCACEPEIVAAVGYVRKQYNPEDVVLVGSSFSASLALRLAGEKPGLVGGVVAFSPGEFFTSEGKCDDWILQSAMKIKDLPVFIAWKKGESDAWGDIAKKIPSEKRTVFVPEEGGHHGARALWESTPGSEVVRAAMKAFLEKYYPVAPKGAEEEAEVEAEEASPPPDEPGESDEGDEIEPRGEQ